MHFLVPFLAIFAIAVFLRMVVPVTVRLATNISVQDLSDLSRSFASTKATKSHRSQKPSNGLIVIRRPLRNGNELPFIRPIPHGDRIQANLDAVTPSCNVFRSRNHRA